MHSTEKKIYAFNYDASTGDLTNERVWYTHSGSGDPDGFKIDEQGNVWQAFYGESRVLKLVDVGGKAVVRGEIRYPTTAITCPVFVGTELWVTTADDHKGNSYGGAVFKCDVGVGGLKEFKFRLEKGVEGV